MSLKYNVIEIFTSEEARWNGRPLHNAIIEHVSKAKIAARCIVSKGIAGYYENGEIASQNLEILSFNMPLKIEIILPSAELETILPGIEEIVTEGIVVVEDMEIRRHTTMKRLIPRQIKVKDAMTPSPKTVTPLTPVSEIISLLSASDFNGIPVVDAENHPVGIITQGDLLSRGGMPIRLGLLAHLEREKIEAYLETVSRRMAKEIMSTPVIIVHQDKRLGEAVDLMLKHGLKRLPVVNVDGALTGILSRLDVFHTITRETPDWIKIKSQNVIVENIQLVSDVMRRDIHTVLPDTPIEQVIRTINSSDIQRVAVVDKKNNLLGLISDRDLLGIFSEHRAGLWDYFVSKLPFTEIAQRHKQFIKLTKMKTAAEVMRVDIVTIKEGARIEEAIKIMAEKGIKRLPVTDEAGIFRGMVSRDSVLRAGIKQ